MINIEDFFLNISRGNLRDKGFETTKKNVVIARLLSYVLLATNRNIFSYEAHVQFSHSYICC